MCRSFTAKAPFALIALAAMTGCTLSQPRPVTFVIRDAETQAPIEGATVKVDYWSMLDFGRPLAWFGPNEGVTDKEGKLTLFMDPCKSSLHLDVEAPRHLRERMWGESVRQRLSYGWWFGAWDELTLDAYREPSAEVELTVPIDYRGPIVARFTREDHPPDPPGKRNFRYKVSPSGIVDIKESGLIERHGRFDAVVARRPGKTFRTVATDPSRPDEVGDPPHDEIALRCVPVEPSAHAWLYVLGTKVEALTVLRQLYPDESHFDEVAFARLMGSK